MNRETQHRIIRTLEQIAHDMGVKGSFPQIARRVQGQVQEILKVARKFQNIRTIRSALAAFPEPNAESVAELENLLKQIPVMMRGFFVEMSKELPQSSIGRNRLLTAKDAQEVNVQIGALLSQGRKLTDACKQMAERKGVSTGTIRRIWQARGKESNHKKLDRFTLEPRDLKIGELTLFGGFVMGLTHTLVDATEIKHVRKPRG